MSFHGSFLCGLLLLCVYYAEAAHKTKHHHHLNHKASAIHLVLLRKHGAHGSKSCRHSAVEAFAASVYARFVISNDTAVVKHRTSSRPNESTVNRLKLLIKKILVEVNQCDADDIAEEVAKAIGRAGTSELSVHFRETAYGVGEFLYESGALTCDNAIQNAQEFFGYVVKAFTGSADYHSYMHGMVHGLADFLIAHHHELKKVTLKLADEFMKEFSKGSDGTCEAPTSGKEL